MLGTAVGEMHVYCTVVGNASMLVHLPMMLIIVTHIHYYVYISTSQYAWTCSYTDNHFRSGKQVNLTLLIFSQKPRSLYDSHRCLKEREKSLSLPKRWLENTCGIEAL